MAPSMAKNRPTSADAAKHPLQASLERIADELNLVRTVLDELRSAFQWAVQNRILPKQDVAARLPQHSMPPVFDPNEVVEYCHGGYQHVAQIVSLDNPTNRATIRLNESGETREVSQYDLLKATNCHARVAQRDSQPSELRAPGELF